MANMPARGALLHKAIESYEKTLRAIVYLFAILAGLGVLTMMAVTFVDVVLRLFRFPIVGAYDIVKIAGTVTIAAALPYTTAVKGHVSIEYFYHKLNRAGRMVLDISLRVLAMALFALSAYHCFLYGRAMGKAGQVTQTLQLPLFWLPYLIAVSFVVVVLVILYNLLHPGREMIKP